MERQQIKKVFDLHLKSLSWDKNDPTQKAMYLRLIDATELIVKNCSIPDVSGWCGLITRIKMGMFDSVWVKCPKCGTENEFQTKSGECFLENYTLENCPDDALANVNRHSPCHCDCGAFYEVDIKERKAVLVAGS